MLALTAVVLAQVAFSPPPLVPLAPCDDRVAPSTVVVNAAQPPDVPGKPWTVATTLVAGLGFAAAGAGAGSGKDFDFGRSLLGSFIGLSVGVMAGLMTGLIADAGSPGGRAASVVLYVLAGVAQVVSATYFLTSLNIGCCGPGP